MTKQSKTRSKRRDFLKLAGAGALTTTLSGCLLGEDGSSDGGGDSSGDSSGDSGGSNDGEMTGTTTGDSGGEGPINILALEPLSGPFSIYGPRHRQGAEFAINQINANGGVLGRELSLKVVDTQNSGDATSTAFTQAIEQDDVVAAIGPGASEVSIRSRIVAEENQVPLYLQASGATEVVPRSARHTFRTALPATPTVGRAQAQLIEERGYTNVGVIYEDGVWGAEYEAAMDEYLPDDINITRDSAPIPQTDFVPILRQFPDDIEIFLGTAHPAGALSMYSQMYEIGMDPDLFLAGISPMAAEYQAIGDTIGESYASFNSTDMYTDEYAEVAQTYNEEVGGLFDHPQVNGYVCIKIIQESIEAGGSVDPAEIAAQTRTGSFDLLYANSLEWTEWGELKDSVQVYNAFDIDSSPDYWPDGDFSPVEEWRSDPLPAYEPGSLGLD